MPEKNEIVTSSTLLLNEQKGANGVYVIAVTFSQDYVCICYSDNKLKVGKIEDKHFKPVHIFEENIYGVYDLYASENHLISTGVDNKIRIYNLDTFNLEKTISVNSKGMIPLVCIVKETNSFLTYSNDGFNEYSLDSNEYRLMSQTPIPDINTIPLCFCYIINNEGDKLILFSDHHSQLHIISSKDPSKFLYQKPCKSRRSAIRIGVIRERAAGDMIYTIYIASSCGNITFFTYDLTQGLSNRLFMLRVADDHLEELVIVDNNGTSLHSPFAPKYLFAVSKSKATFWIRQGDAKTSFNFVMAINNHLKTDKGKSSLSLKKDLSHVAVLNAESLWIYNIENSAATQQE